MSKPKKKGGAKSKPKKKGGAKSKYKKDYIKKMLAYFDIEPYQIEERKRVANDLPTFQGFTKQVHISLKTLQTWAQKHDEFGEAWALCKDMQYHILVTNGLRGLYSTPSWIFAAKNIIGFRDVQDLKVGGDKDQPLTVKHELAGLVNAVSKRTRKSK